MNTPKTTQNQPDLSIIIPAYCEEHRIEPTLDEVALFLKQDQYFRRKNVEVVVVAADAPDRTHEIIASKRKLFHHLEFLKPGPHVGKGRDVQCGMLSASGKVVVFMDADLATPLYHLRKFYKLCTDGCDVVIGTRNLLTYRHNIARGLFAYTGNVLYRLAGGVGVEDTQCGFKMFTAKAANICFKHQTILGWGFDVEILTIAKENGLRIHPVRLNDWQHKPYSTYNERMGAIVKRTVRDFFFITRNRLRSTYRYLIPVTENR